MKNRISDMFAAAVTTKSNHPGYMVSATDCAGISDKIGPYSRDIALTIAREGMRNFPTVDVMDMATGEIIYYK